MANIEVLEQWDEGIYQLETTDPVQGGADGVDNLPHKNLANRTEWLKKNKAEKNGNAANKFQVANGTTESDAVNKGQLDTKANLTGSITQIFKVANATLTDEAVNLGQLNTKINISDIQDLLTSTDVTKPLSANQGKILKGFIDNIMAILNSDDTTLDELQEIVNFIKQNKSILDTLGISNIAGLSDALNNIYTKVQVDNILLSVISAGTVIAFANSSVPTGFLECNGALLSRTTYANLFAVIGTTYGVGDGSTTFAIPDLRGEFIRGFDNGKGTDSGRTIGSSQSDNFKTHNHPATGTNYLYSNPSSGNPIVGAGVVSSGSAGGMTTVVASQGGTETRPRNIAMMYCIKY